MPKLTKTLLDKSKKIFQSYWAALIWAAFILLLCSLPGYDLPNIDFWDIDIEDKLAHVGVFTILGFLMVYGQRRHHLMGGKIISKNILLRFVIIAAAYGAFTEILQGLFFITRTADVFDFVADSLGGFLGIIIGNLYFKYRSRN